MTRAVDLVVCAHGRSPYLDRCLASLEPQVGEGVALWVSTSTPNSHILRAATQYRAQCVVNSKHEGIASDWNFALSVGAAPLVVLCHQDDEYAPTFSKRIAAAFDLAPDVLFAACDHTELSTLGPRAISLNLKIKRLLVSRVFKASGIQFGPSIRRRLLGWGNPLSCPSVMINRALVPDFQFDRNFSSNLDWDAWERLARRPGYIAFVTEALVAHRVHKQSATTELIANSIRQAEDILMLRRFWPMPIAWLLFQAYRLAYRGND
ncbi:glycosyltransferase family 2 protein [Inhella proteolytica]|uniref:Glycosyltransferase family 2 protein n=1 Tax=Inhella proteolytica TaxID=2795029 RepID=A0A931J7U0_9BURK|nr:glycosyltransferase family A protein [Inhella proteolytica]MBH9578382.1 glycosyltransferase family 2 protein [Inhella proteolytica]